MMRPRPAQAVLCSAGPLLTAVSFNDIFGYRAQVGLHRGVADELCRASIGILAGLDHAIGGRCAMLGRRRSLGQS